MAMNCEERHKRDFANAAHPKLTGGRWGDRQSNGSPKNTISLTSEMPHLCIFACPRLCQNLTRSDALQLLGDVPVVRILPASCLALRRGLSENRRRRREKAASR
jgi:hypothetical protein